MSSLGWQRQNSNARRSTELSTMSFREKLQRKLRKMDMDRITKARFRHMIQYDPVQAMKEMSCYAMEKGNEK